MVFDWGKKNSRCKIQWSLLIVKLHKNLDSSIFLRRLSKTTKEKWWLIQGLAHKIVNTEVWVSIWDTELAT